MISPESQTDQRVIRPVSTGNDRLSGRGLRRFIPEGIRIKIPRGNEVRAALHLGTHKAIDVAASAAHARVGGVAPEVPNAIRSLADAAHAVVNSEPVTWPQTAEQLAAEYNQLNSGRDLYEYVPPQGRGRPFIGTRVEVRTYRNDYIRKDEISPHFADTNPRAQVLKYALEPGSIQVRPGFLGIKAIRGWVQEVFGRGPQQWTEQAQIQLGQAAIAQATNLAIAAAHIDHINIHTSANAHELRKAVAGLGARGLITVIENLPVIHQFVVFAQWILRGMGFTGKRAEALVRGSMGTQVVVGGQVETLRHTDGGISAIEVAVGLIAKTAQYRRLQVNGDQGMIQIEPHDVSDLLLGANPAFTTNWLINHRDLLPKVTQQRVTALLKGEAFHQLRVEDATSQASGVNT